MPTYAHVPLALNPEGRRLAKRDGAVTLADLAAQGRTPAQVLGLIAASLGLPPAATVAGLLPRSTRPGCRASPGSSTRLA